MILAGTTCGKQLYGCGRNGHGRAGRGTPKEIMQRMQLFKEVKQLCDCGKECNKGGTAHSQKCSTIKACKKNMFPSWGERDITTMF